jgi:hypothetical protein
VPIGYGAGVRRLGTLAIPLLVSALIAAGCGGGGGDNDTSSASTSSGPLTKAEYIAKGDQICAQGTLVIGQAGREQFGTSQPTREQAVQFGQDTVVPSLEDTLTKLRALEVPQGDEAETTAIYTALEDGINKLKDDPNLFVESASGGAFDRANQLAQAYGFKQCGQS